MTPERWSSKVRLTSTWSRTRFPDCGLGRPARNRRSRPGFRSRRTRRSSLVGGILVPKRRSHLEVVRPASRPEVVNHSPRRLGAGNDPGVAGRVVDRAAERELGGSQPGSGGNGPTRDLTTEPRRISELALAQLTRLDEFLRVQALGGNHPAVRASRDRDLGDKNVVRPTDDNLGVVAAGGPEEDCNAHGQHDHTTNRQASRAPRHLTSSYTARHSSSRPSTQLVRHSGVTPERLLRELRRLSEHSDRADEAVPAQSHSPPGLAPATAGFALRPVLDELDALGVLVREGVGHTGSSDGSAGRAAARDGAADDFAVEVGKGRELRLRSPRSCNSGDLRRGGRRVALRRLRVGQAEGQDDVARMERVAAILGSADHGRAVRDDREVPVQLDDRFALSVDDPGGLGTEDLRVRFAQQLL